MLLSVPRSPHPLCRWYIICQYLVFVHVCQILCIPTTQACLRSARYKGGALQAGPLSWWGWGWGGGVSCVGRSPVLAGMRVGWGLSCVGWSPVLVGMRVGWGCLLCGPVPCPGGDEGGVGVSPVWGGPLSWRGWGWGGGVSCVGRSPVLAGMRVVWGCLPCGPVPCPGGVEGGVGVSPVWTGPLSWWGGGWGGGVSCVDRSPVLVGWRVIEL